MSSGADQLVFWAFLCVILIVPWIMARAPGGGRQPGPGPASGTEPGSRFTSDREKRLWIYTLIVMLAIYSTLSPAQRVAAELRERGLLGVSSAAAMVVVALIIGVHWVKTRPGRREIGAGIGVAAIYLTTIIRLPVPEARSHLFEYGLVALLIDQALTERVRNGRPVPVPPLLAVGATAALGWIDEGIQALLPNRVYDLADVGLNAAFAVAAIASSLVMRWARSLDVLNRMRGFR